MVVEASGPERGGEHVFRGVILMIAFCLVVPLLDVFSKLAAEKIPVAQITAARFLLQSLFMFPVLLYLGRSLRLPMALLPMLLLRAVFLIFSTFFFVTAISVMLLADALAIVFIEPFIILLFGKFVLGEMVGIRRLGACLVGFGGVLLVIQPSFAAFGYVALFPLLVAFSFAFYMLITRSLSARMDVVSMQFHTANIGAVICVPALYFGGVLSVEMLTYVTPEPLFALWLLGVGFFASVSHFLMSLALQYAPSSTLAPLHYLELIMAGVLGYVIFSDVPNALALCGMVIVILSGLYVVYRERVLNS